MFSSMPSQAPGRYYSLDEGRFSDLFTLVDQGQGLESFCIKARQNDNLIITSNFPRERRRRPTTTTMKTTLFVFVILAIVAIYANPAQDELEFTENDAVSRAFSHLGGGNFLKIYSCCIMIFCHNSFRGKGDGQRPLLRAVLQQEQEVKVQGQVQGPLRGPLRRSRVQLPLKHLQMLLVHHCCLKIMIMLPFRKSTAWHFKEQYACTLICRQIEIQVTALSIPTLHWSCWLWWSLLLPSPPCCVLFHHLLLSLDTMVNAQTVQWKCWTWAMSNYPQPLGQAGDSTPSLTYCINTRVSKISISEVRRQKRKRTFFVKTALRPGLKHFFINFCRLEASKQAALLRI